ncbi:MAG: polysaccharide biosynthesis/export family protein, partial [Myxococcota bacterium]
MEAFSVVSFVTVKHIAYDGEAALSYLRQRSQHGDRATGSMVLLDINMPKKNGIEVLQDPSLTREVLVLPDGSFSFPFAGNVNASGRSTDQVQSTLAQGISGNFASEPNVFVSVRTLRAAPAATGGGGGGRASIDVYFLGEFNAPGQLSLDRGTTILQALAEAGGLSPFAADRRIQLRRTDRSGRQN